LALAASTGGPPALAKLLASLPGDFPLPILVVQHMGAAFMEGFAAWLDGLVALTVGIAPDGEAIAPGRVYVAPGDRHLTLTASHMVKLTDAEPISGQRPSATALFASVARNAGREGIGVLLTGMGEDGADGLLALRRAGGQMITEAESSAVVYGMP